jgi:hypothetical protein
MDTGFGECRAQFAQRLALAPSWAAPPEWETDNVLAGLIS